MSSITSSAGGYYYPLSGSGSQASSATGSLSSALLNASSTGVSSFDSSAYTLDLSPEAQKYLSGLNNGQGSTQFTLSDKQQQAINDILAKYKDAPFTQDTFNQIQNDLNAANLGPQFLALTDKINSFNPSQVLIDALNGGASSNVTGLGDLTSDNSSNQQTKIDNYMQGIISQWKSVSTTAGDSSTPNTPEAA